MGYVIAVRVTPRSARPGVGPWRTNPARRGEELEVRVAASPVDGAANAAVVEALAKALKVPRSAMTIVSGQTSRHKRVELPLSAEEVRERLG